MELSQALKYYSSFERVMDDDEIPLNLKEIYSHISQDDTLEMISKKIGKKNTLKFTFLYYLRKKGVSESKYKNIIDNLKNLVIIKFIDSTYKDVDCDYCGGWGRETCDYCDGTGTVDCRYCDGSGEETCDSCDGSGEIDDESCGECNGSGSLTCVNCGGEGKEDCNYCGGDGDFQCDHCDGNGTVDTDEEYYQPEEFYYVKPIKDIDYELEDKVFERNKISKLMDNDPLCLFIKVSYVGFEDEPVEETKSKYKTDFNEFEIVEIFDL